MFLHLGDDVSVSIGDIVAIYDFSLFADGVNKKFFERYEKKGLVKSNLPDGKKPRSAVVTDEGIYLSLISSATLQKRAAMPFDDDGC